MKEYIEDGLVEPGSLDFRLRQIEETIDDETEQILSCLAPDDREIFRRLYVEEDDIDSISNELGISKPLLYSRVSRGKKKLRSFFGNKKENAYERNVI